MIVGLTGSIATGKSTVSKILSDLGAVIVDADKIVRHVQAKGEAAWRDIVTAFGEEILLKSGELDRAKLGSIVFSDTAKREQLNTIVHPRVREERDRQTEAALSANPRQVVVWDIPLLIETGIYKDVDKTIVVYVDQETQLRRLLERDKLALEQAQKRIAAQMPVEEKKTYADYLIDNRGTLEETREQVRRAYVELTELAHRGAEA
ncbi:MAG TPA: dephospho-CoA kinase [Bacilli bacterium]|nr:dephospho-CoA kinase [Bacilli bacterium]